MKHYHLTQLLRQIIHRFAQHVAIKRNFQAICIRPSYKTGQLIWASRRNSISHHLGANGHFMVVSQNRTHPAKERILFLVIVYFCENLFKRAKNKVFCFMFVATNAICYVV